MQGTARGVLQRTGTAVVSAELQFDLGESAPGNCKVAAAWKRACAVTVLVAGTNY